MFLLLRGNAVPTDRIQLLAVRVGLLAGPTITGWGDCPLLKAAMSSSRHCVGQGVVAAVGIVAALSAAVPAHGGDGALIADSVAEFSSGQGADNWHYGYYASAGDPDSFTELCCHDPAGGFGAWWERAATQPPWNLIWAGGQHPDETRTVRRWVSEVTGFVRVDVTTDHWLDQPGAKTVQVLYDGSVLYERTLAEGAGGPLAESVFTIVATGGFLDFTVSTNGDTTGTGTLVEAEIYRLAVIAPTVDAEVIIEVNADAGQCESTFVPAEPAVTPSCQDGIIVITPARSDGLPIDDPYPAGITRIDWTIEELGCPNESPTFEQWILVRVDGCPDCGGPQPGSGCGVHNVTQDTLFLTIQGAIDDALDGDEIVVAAGTYHETIDLLGKPLTLRSADGPQLTIIDIQGMADSVVTCAGGEGPETTLEGFTIAGGDKVGDGGAMFISQSGPTVTGCVVRDNSATGQGGGIYCTDDSHPALTGCTFTANTADGHGGGLYSTGSSLTVTGCVFAGNAALRGAGLYMLGGLEATVVNSVFSGNMAAEGAGMWIGVFDFDAVVQVTNCTFSGNTGQLGSGIWMASACESQVAVTNCILWNQVVFEPCPDRCYEYNDGVFGCGTGNINADPQFIDFDGPDDIVGTPDDDVRLLGGSPCLDAGHNWAIAGIIDTDLDGNPRFADDQATTDTGCGAPVVVDIGAHEFQGDPFPVRYGDIDGDGMVGIGDFLAVIGGWGPCPDTCCLADLDLDGFVGIAEFLIVIGNWTA